MSLGTKGAAFHAHVTAILGHLRQAAVIGSIAAIGLGGWYAFASVRHYADVKAAEKQATAPTAPPITSAGPPVAPPKKGGFLHLQNVGGTGQAFLSVRRPLPATKLPDGTLVPAPANCPSAIDVYRAPTPKDRKAFEALYHVDLDKNDLLASLALATAYISATVPKGSTKAEVNYQEIPRKAWGFPRELDVYAALRGELDKKDLGGYLAVGGEPVRYKDLYLRGQFVLEEVPFATPKLRKEWTLGLKWKIGG